MAQKVTIGSQHADESGVITYINDFDVSIVKRIYFIENNEINFIRAWQGHKIEQRWFSAVSGTFRIQSLRTFFLLTIRNVTLAHLTSLR